MPTASKIFIRTHTNSDAGELYDVHYAVIDSASLGDNTIVAAVAGKVIRVIHYKIWAVGAVACRFESGAGGEPLTGQMSLSIADGHESYCPEGLFQTEAGDLLNLELSTAVSVDGHLSYIWV